MNAMYLERIDSRKEIDTLYDLVKMVWTQYYGPIMGEGKVARFLEMKQSKARIQQDIASGSTTYYFIYSKATNEIIGYLAYHFTEAELVIDKLYLIYSVRGQGLTHELISYLENEAAKRGLRTSEVWVNQENQTGIAVFKHFGFTEFSTRRNPLDQGYVLNEVGLRKTL